MKKTLFITLFIFIVIASNVIFATDAGDIDYEGEVEANVPKKANVSLVGTNATAYSNVRIKVDIEGPATPEILATDSQGVTYDIAKIGYWGPDSGFAVGGTFENVTPITITYPQAGTYVTTLSLVDVSNEETVITSKEFSAIVVEEAIENNNVVNNTIEEIPQTGVSIWTYIVIGIAVIAIVLLARKIISKNN